MRCKKRILFPLMLVMILCLSTSLTCYAAGDGNIDNGGSSLGEGTATDIWHHEDGVRVTVVTTDGTIAATPFDLTNYDIGDNIIHFGKVSKLQYTAGRKLSPGGFYSCSKPGTALPQIISRTQVKSNLTEIKRYFCSEYAAQLVTSQTGISYDDLISGNYKLVIEPIAYFTHGGCNYAMTATEAALYNQMSGGALRKTMTSLTHQNLPLALFLEYSDLGYPAWTGTRDGKVSDTDIITALGIGIVSYQEASGSPADTPDYTYRVDTDVITSVTLTSTTEITPDHPASVTFKILGQTYTVNDIVMPAGSSQLVWVKWHTPSSPTTISIDLAVYGASTAKTSFWAQIVSLDENPPPDPQATDTNPGFRIPSLPPAAENTYVTWSVWNAHWVPDWHWDARWEWIYGPFWSDGECTENCPRNCNEDHSGIKTDWHWEDLGEWVDHGEYEFTATSYYAYMSGNMQITPDVTIPDYPDNYMRSGYGITETASAAVTSNAPSYQITQAQNAITYFPEFNYETYWRLLSLDPNNNFIFKSNPYSIQRRNVHFTPVWYPDNAYTVYTRIIDAWTPAGMLSINLNDSLQIQGSLFDDWYSKRE